MGGEEARHGMTRFFAEALRAERDARHEQVQEVKKGITELQIITGDALVCDDSQDLLSRKVLDLARNELKEMVDTSFRDFQSTAMARLAAVQEKMQELAMGTLSTKLSSMELQLEASLVNSPASATRQPVPMRSPVTPVGPTSVLGSPAAPSPAQSAPVLDNRRSEPVFRSIPPQRGPGSAASGGSDTPTLASQGVQPATSSQQNVRGAGSTTQQPSPYAAPVRPVFQNTGSGSHRGIPGLTHYSLRWGDKYS